MGVMNCQWRSGFACATLLVALAACDSGEGSAATTTIVTVASPSTLPPPSTTAVATTPPVTTAVATTVSPTTTPADTSVVTTAGADEEAAKAAVIAAAVEAIESWWALRQDPTNAELQRRVMDAYEGDSERTALERIGALIAAEEYVVPNPAIQADYRILTESVDVDLQGGTASLTACELNSWIRVRRSPTGVEIVVDDSVSSTSSTERFELVDSRWVRTAGDVIEAVEGDSACAD